MDATRALLDELMGKDRDVPLAMKGSNSIQFSDPLVCKYQLCGLCPNRLFKNTKSDLGPCQFEYHEDHLEWEQIQAQWDELSDGEKERYGYERDTFKYLDQLIRDMDRKIQKAKERAEKESAPKEVSPENQARLDELQSKAKEALEKSQKMGEDGDVDGAMMFSQQAENYKNQHELLLKQLTQPDRTMTVCDICGVFINSTDNEQRRKVRSYTNPAMDASTQPLLPANQDHLNGKQYQGWKKIREKFAEITERLETLRKNKESTTHSRSRSRDGEKEKERDHVREKSKERGRERERDRSPRREERYRKDDRYDERYRRDEYRDYRSGRDSRDQYGYGGGYRRDDYRRDRGGYGYGYEDYDYRRRY